MRYLRTNTSVRVTVGPFLDETDGVTPQTGLTTTSCHLTLMVDDGNVPTLVLDADATASGGNNDLVHVTNDDAGFYDLELTNTNLNYLGRAMLAITDASHHCPVFHEFMIVPAMVYDSLILATDDLDTNSKKWNDLTTVDLPLAPTTAGRKLDVTTTGEAGLDLDNTAGTLAAAEVNADLDTYQAQVTVDHDTLGTRDLYVTIWLKNGQPIVAGITSPDIWLYDEAANDIIGTTGSPVAMTEIGSSQTFKYEATGADILAAGTAYVARVRCTIAAATRSWYVQVSRDS